MNYSDHLQRLQQSEKPERPKSTTNLSFREVLGMDLERFLELITKPDGKARLNHPDRCESVEIMRFVFWRNLTPQDKERYFAMTAGSIIVDHWGGDPTPFNCYAATYLLALYDKQPGSTHADLESAWRLYKIARKNNFQAIETAPATTASEVSVITPEKMQEMFWKMFKDSPEKIKEFTGGFNQD